MGAVAATGTVRVLPAATEKAEAVAGGGGRSSPRGFSGGYGGNSLSELKVSKSLAHSKQAPHAYPNTFQYILKHVTGLADAAWPCLCLLLHNHHLQFTRGGLQSDAARCALAH